MTRNDFSSLKMVITLVKLCLFALFVVSQVKGITVCNYEIGCPANKPYCSDAGCVYECPTPLYTNASTCVLSCGDWYVVHSSCSSACPVDWLYMERPRVLGSETFIDKVCIQECDHGHYRFGNTCVPACPLEFGYVDENLCVQRCPENKPYQTNFTVRSVLYQKCSGKCPFLTDGIYCTDKCVIGQFVFNSTCVEECPASHPVHSGTKCLEKCSDSDIYQVNNTCFKKCSTEKPFYFPDNRTCGETCPSQFYVTNRSTVLYCEDSCRGNEVIYQRSCQNSCFDPRIGMLLYVLNGTCVAQCPRGFLTNDYGQLRYCSETCDDEEFIYENSCVRVCPSNTYLVNKTCLQSCPSERPFVCRVRKGQTCNEICPPDGGVIYGFRDDDYMFEMCVAKCPFYTDHNTCVQICPNMKYTSTNMCVTQCPSSAPLIQATLTNYQTCSSCWWCGGGYTTETHSEVRQTCMSKCSEGLVSFNATCQHTCPYTHPYLVNDTCQQEKCQMLMYKTSSFNLCTDSCKADEFVYNDTCMKQCPDGSHVTGNICHENTCETKYEYNIGSVTLCVNNCTSYGFVLNTSCVDTCPHVTFNNICSTFCPATHPLFLEHTIPGSKDTITECVNECTENFVHFNGSCVHHCPMPLLLFNRSCVKTCPESHPYKQPVTKDRSSNSFNCTNACVDPYPLLDTHNWTCVDTCPLYAYYVYLNRCEKNCPSANFQFRTDQGMRCSTTCPAGKLQYNSTCMDTCPAKMYNFSGETCVYECSGSMPFGLKTDPWRCIDACESNRYFKDGRCIEHYECREPDFIYFKECVSECPAYYLWDDGCFSIFRQILPLLLISSSVYVAIIIYFRQILKEFFEVLIAIVTCKRVVLRDEDESEIVEQDGDEMQPLV